jgi:hypothetical protein
MENRARESMAISSLLLRILLFVDASSCTFISFVDFSDRLSRVRVCDGRLYFQLYSTIYCTCTSHSQTRPTYSMNSQRACVVDLHVLAVDASCPRLSLNHSSTFYFTMNTFSLARLGVFYEPKRSPRNRVSTKAEINIFCRAQGVRPWVATCSPPDMLPLFQQHAPYHFKKEDIQRKAT